MLAMTGLYIVLIGELCHCDPELVSGEAISLFLYQKMRLPRPAGSQ